ncbi:hypothetical protein MUK42_31984 [Musa troglodytarum]|uniref:Uncharacterized protein n=1 Tax=Musa troglodytarum TaxID=320322 RepID=A0A9E7JU62_9LILI|nr:hypothetical protein MUK42_31984 [Musa troglodytarum]
MVWVVVLVSRPRLCPCTGGSMATTTTCSMVHLRSKLLRPPQKASGPSSSSSSSSWGTGRRPPPRLYTESFLVVNKDTSSPFNSSILPSIRIKVGRHSHSSSPTLRFVATPRYLPTATVPAIRLRYRCRKGRKDLSSQQPWSRYMRWCEHRASPSLLFTVQAVE